MQVLLTGATGFIGRHLVHRLVREGWIVHALVRNLQKIKNLPTSGVHWIEGDLRLLRDEQLQLPPMDIVVHLAGIVHEHRRGEYAEINIRGVADLVALLNRQAWRPKRLLFASSLAAAGPTLPGIPLTEDAPLLPNEVYGASKRDAEKALLAADFPVTIFRPGAVIGSGDPEFLTLFKMARRGFGFRIAGINPHFSFVSIDDLVEAVWLMMQDDAPENRTYFVSHDEPAHVRLLWETMQRVMGRKIMTIVIPRPVLWFIMQMMSWVAQFVPIKNQLDRREYIQMTTAAYLGSSARLQKDLDWRPTVDFEATLRAAYEGYRQNQT